MPKDTMSAIAAMMVSGRDLVASAIRAKKAAVRASTMPDKANHACRWNWSRLSVLDLLSNES